MKKVKFCSIFCVFLLLISKVFAVEYMDIKVNIISSTYKSIVIYIRNDNEDKYFWGCRFMGHTSEPIDKFLGKINCLSIPSTLPMYKSIEKACVEYDKLRFGDVDDFEGNTIYLFNYSPDNEYFQTIIKSLQSLSKCYFDLNLLHSITIR